MAQVRVLNDTLSKASPYLIANNDLFGTVEPRDASRVTYDDRPLPCYSSGHDIHDDHRIRKNYLFILAVVSHLAEGF